MRWIHWRPSIFEIRFEIRSGNVALAMRHPYGLTDRDEGAIWVYLGVDLVWLFATELILHKSTWLEGAEFWAPVILVILNLVAFEIFFHRSVRRIQTRLLGVCVALIVGIINGIIVVNSYPSSDPDKHEVGMAFQVSCWVLPAIASIGVYFSVLNRNRD